MNKTMELLDAALKVKKKAVWARELNVSDATLTNAERRGSLSPSISYHLAEGIGLDPIYWAAVAGLETDRNEGPRETMLKRLEQSARKWSRAAPRC